MDCSKVGNLIYRLRKEKNMTQKDIANALNISDRTISKWERGLGCPDVSLLGDLSNLLGVNVEQILAGELASNDANGGNMKNVKFYVCQNCGNVICSTGEADIACCGRKLTSLIAKPQDEGHKIVVEEIENDFYITIQHDMSKTHYISFVACVSGDRVVLIKLYPEQGAEVRLPKMYRSQIYVYCTNHGLWMVK